MKKAWVVIAFMFVSASVSAERVVRLNETQLQLMLISMMPFKKSFPMIDVSVTRPDVNLFSETEKIGVSGNVQLSGNGFDFNGSVALSGKVDIDPANSQVFLREVTIDSMKFDNMPPELESIQGLVEWALEFVAGFALNSFPVYTFKESDMRQLLVSKALKDVRVKNNRLELVFDN